MATGHPFIDGNKRLLWLLQKIFWQIADIASMHPNWKSSGSGGLDGVQTHAQSTVPVVFNPEKRMVGRISPHGTIFAIGISKISSAPHAFSFGISRLTVFFGTTVWIL